MPKGNRRGADSRRFERLRESFYFKMWLSGREYVIDAEATRLEIVGPPECVDLLSSVHHTLMYAIAAFTGISGLSAVIIPMLLFPERLPSVTVQREANFVISSGLVVRYQHPWSAADIIASGRRTVIDYEPVLED